MSVVLGTPGGPFGHLAKDHWLVGITSPAGISGLEGRGESLGRIRSSAAATTWSVETASSLRKLGSPLSGRVNTAGAAPLASLNSTRIRWVIGPPSVAIGNRTVSRLF